MLKIVNGPRGVLGLTDDFGGYNHVRTEEVDKANGTVTIVDTWVLCDDIAFGIKLL